jgi:integrase
LEGKMPFDEPPTRAETRGRKSSGARLKYVSSTDQWRIYDGTTQKVVARGAHSRREAEKAFAQYLTAKTKTVAANDPTKVTVADVLGLYAETQTKSASARTTGHNLDRLMDFFGEDAKAGEVTAAKCREYVTWRTAQPRAFYKDKTKAPLISSTTATRELNTLGAALVHAFKENVLDREIPITLPPSKPPRERFLTRSEAARLLWAAMGFHKDANGKTKRTRGSIRFGAGGGFDEIGPNRHLCRFILLALYTGTRFSATTKLRWDKTADDGWIDLDRAIIYRRGDGEAITNKRRKPCPIPSRLLPHLRRWKELGTDSGYVIEWQGHRVTTIKHSWKTARERAGLGPDVTPHILKHTCITWLLQAGRPTWEVSGFTSTSEEVIRNVYGHHSPEWLRETADAFSVRTKPGQVPKITEKDEDLP